MRKKFLALLLCVTTVYAAAQVESYLKKAQSHVENGHLREAIGDYRQALEKEPSNRNANLGLGLIYSEWLDNYPAALPYLENAYSVAVRDSAYDLIFALAKCYHYAGNYDKALGFYNRLQGVQDLEDESNFQKEVNKRRADCEYARNRKDAPKDENIYLVNCGKSINTDMPEYVPVLVGNKELLFTSKRKDTNREELNYLDGKYFESMYLAQIQPNTFTGLRRYTLPDKLLDSKFYRHHQAVVSMSQDGTRLFTFRDGKLFEIDVEERKDEQPSQVKIRKFDHYANHAFLTRDGKTLYFTSEMQGGMGGTDIFVCTKSANGEWGSPVNLGAPVNTAFNEDAPFLAADGTLYFASEGHEGYGNYDIYRSYFSEGKWTNPENLGEPINSAGHDIFLVLDSAGTSGYFSSGRNGGFGDMDIYKVVYLDKYPRDCKPFDARGLNLSASDQDTSDYKNTVQLNVASNYRVLQSDWTLQGKPAGKDLTAFENDYGQTGTFPVSAKVLAWCDTCLSPVVACLDFENKIEKIKPSPVIAVIEKTDKPVKEVEKEKNITQPEQTIAAIDTKQKEREKSKTATNAPGCSGPPRPNVKAAKTQLFSAQEPDGFELNAGHLAEMGYNNAPLQFEFNKPGMSDETRSILDQNVDILKRNSTLRISIEGYADARGGDAINQRISQQRADNVKRYLLSKGLPARQIKESKGRGATSFLNHCSTGVECSDEEHALNRRVEFKIFQTARIK